MSDAFGHMRLAGIPVRHDLVVELAEILTHAGFIHTAGSILRAHADQHEIGLTTDDREAIVRALEDPPDGLKELRAALLRSP